MTLTYCIVSILRTITKKQNKSLTKNEKAICRIALNIRENEFTLTKDCMYYTRKYVSGFQTNPLFIGSTDQDDFLMLLLEISKLNEKRFKLEEKYGLYSDEIMAKNMELNRPISSLPQI